MPIRKHVSGGGAHRDPEGMQGVDVREFEGHRARLVGRVRTGGRCVVGTIAAVLSESLRRPVARGVLVARKSGPHTYGMRTAAEFRQKTRRSRGHRRAGQTAAHPRDLNPLRANMGSSRVVAYLPDHIAELIEKHPMFKSISYLRYSKPVEFRIRQLILRFDNLQAASYKGTGRTIKRKTISFPFLRRMAVK